MIHEESRQCTFCQAVLKGRIDKRFCNDYCRNNYNNRLKQLGVHSIQVRRINNVLLRNRKILSSFLPGIRKKTKATRSRLLQLGFDFNYFTHKYNSHGKTYFYCYDHGYLPLRGNWYQVIKSKEE